MDEKSRFRIAGPLFFFKSLLVAILAFFPAVSAYGAEIVGIAPLFDITGGFKEPSDVAVSKSGRIYVADGVNHRIKVFDQSGEPLFSFGKKGGGSGQLRAPLGIDVGASGRVYVADSGNHRIQIFDADGAFLTGIDLAAKDDEPADPTDVAVNEDNSRLYAVDNDHHRFLVYDLKTQELRAALGEPGDQERMFRFPFFATLNRERQLLIVDVINTRVQVLDSDGSFIRYIGTWGVEAGELFRPKGVAVDTRNNVYISDSYMGVIQVFDPLGDLIGVIGDADTGKVKKFRTPVGLDIDDAGRLYVVEMLAQQVSVHKIEAKSR
jgi:DNA-binding beta-propeller fold protein YncE